MMCGTLPALAPARRSPVGCFPMGLGFYMLRNNTLQTNATQMAPGRRGAAVSARLRSPISSAGRPGVSVAGWAVSRAGTALTFPVAGLGIAAIGLAFAALKRRAMQPHHA